MELQVLSEFSSFQADSLVQSVDFKIQEGEIFAIGTALFKRILFVPSGTHLHQAQFLRYRVGKFSEMELQFLSEFSSFQGFTHLYQAQCAIYRQGKFSRMELQFLSEFSSFPLGIYCSRHSFLFFIQAGKVFANGAALSKQILFVPSGIHLQEAQISRYTQGKFSRLELHFFSEFSSFQARLYCSRRTFQDIGSAGFQEWSCIF